MLCIPSVLGHQKVESDSSISSQLLHIMLAQPAIETSSAHVLARVTAEPLRLEELVGLVESPSAGAISTFSGVTRNNFDGKEVLRLEYEAYVPMATKKLEEICSEIKKRWSVIGVAIAHRVGVVEVGEPSVIIAVSSAHRHNSLQAVAWAIDELKAVVPIWKKEFFTDGSTWKENAESRARLLGQGGP